MTHSLWTNPAFLINDQEKEVIWKRIKNFIFYEISDFCRAEFMLKDSEFHPTEDAVVIGIEKGENAKDALRNLRRECPWIKNTN